MLITVKTISPKRRGNRGKVHSRSEAFPHFRQMNLRGLCASASGLSSVMLWEVNKSPSKNNCKPNAHPKQYKLIRFRIMPATKSGEAPPSSSRTLNLQPLPGWGSLLVLPLAKESVARKVILLEDLQPRCQYLGANESSAQPDGITGDDEALKCH